MSPIFMTSSAPGFRAVMRFIDIPYMRESEYSVSPLATIWLNVFWALAICAVLYRTGIINKCPSVSGACFISGLYCLITSGVTSNFSPMLSSTSFSSIR